MSSLVIIGATGFLGKAFILSDMAGVPIKAVARRVPLDVSLLRGDVTWHEADVLEAGALDLILEVGDVVINLLYISGENEEDNSSVLQNILESCKKCGVSRLLHCSTAVVAGATDDTFVTELTTCKPQTRYERVKYALEQQVLMAAQTGLDVAVLRPTAIVGPGGKNLVKLASALKNGSPLVNYFRASLYGSRPMHLVPVCDVVSALCYLAKFHTALNGHIFIISADDDQENNFKQVESALMASMGMKPRKYPAFPLPLIFLSQLLRLLGRTDFNMEKRYSSNKLTMIGYTRNASVSSAVCEFGQYFSHD